MFFVDRLAILGWGVPVAYVLQGWLIALSARWGLLWMLNRVTDAPKDIPAEYNDKVIRYGVIAALIWAIIGFTVGDILVWQLAFPTVNGDVSWSSFGRLRPVHTSGVIFGFGGNALIAMSFYVVKRTSRARLASETLPWLVFWGCNLFMVVAATGYPLGITHSKEYAEPEWYADLLLLVVWTGYLTLYLKTLSRRVEPHIYVANWYYLAFIVVIAMLHTVNNLSVPVSIAYPKSYSLFSGTQDAMKQWWYGHNAVGFLLTAGFLGMLYYFLPKAVNRPIYSYRMSIILLVPSWASVFNGSLTISGAWDKLRTDPAVRFLMVAILFYGLSTFEGAFMAIRPVNSLSHYTDWTVGHVHAGALGWVAFITVGAMYKLVPWI